MGKPDSCAPPPRDWAPPEPWGKRLTALAAEGVERARAQLADAYEVVFKTYGKDVITFPGRCEDECLTSAVRLFGSRNSSGVYEARQYCKFACAFPRPESMESCMANCYKACALNQGAEVGLPKILYETRTVYGADNPRKTRECMDMCAEGCTIRLTGRKSMRIDPVDVRTPRL